MTNSAVEKTSPTQMIKQYTSDFATVLPQHVKAESWVRLAQGALRRNADLAKAAERNPGSLMNALLDAARLGLEPGSDEYWLVPFGNEVTGIVGFQGEIEMIYRAGAVSSVKAEIVYANDHFEFDPSMDRPIHKPDWFGDRGDMIGVYAYAVMRDGSTSRVIVMSKADIDQVKAVSKTAKSSSSPWQQWPDRMWIKTTIHQLAKFVPTSAEYRREQLRAASEVAREATTTASVPPSAPPPNVDTDTGEVFDGEVVDEPVAEQATEPEGNAK